MVEMIDGHRRQRELALEQDPDLWRPVIIIGVGGIGSWVALELVKLGVRELVLVDPDIVEPHNAAYTCYQRKQSGQKKVEALRRLLVYTEHMKGVKRRARISAVSNPSCLNKDFFPDKSIVVMAVDNMDTRKSLWEECILNNARVLFFVEGRMGSEAFMLYSLRPVRYDDVIFYQKPEILYSQSQAAEGTCANQSFVYTAAVCGSLIALQIKKFLCKEEYGREIMVDLKNMSIKVNNRIIPEG